MQHSGLQIYRVLRNSAYSDTPKTLGEDFWILLILLIKVMIVLMKGWLGGEVLGGRYLVMTGASLPWK